MRSQTISIAARGGALYTPHTVSMFPLESRLSAYTSRYTPRPVSVTALPSRYAISNTLNFAATLDAAYIDNTSDDVTSKPQKTKKQSPTKATTKAAKARKSKKSAMKAGKGRKSQKNAPLIGLISSKNPVAALEVTVQSLFAGGASRVVVVDDGSDDPDSFTVFNHVEAAGGEVIHLEKNMGKSRALKRAFETLPKKCIIVQTDDDTLATDLNGPASLIREGKADIVDIRVETTRTSSLIGLIQELDYWLINAVTKRVQDVLRARLWMSGASVMYSYDAGKDILELAHTLTEDTEGLFRARQKGWKVRFYSKHDGQFLTMVPEDFPGLHKQWRRWAFGGGQIIGIYGMGGGNLRIAAVNVFAWFNLLVMPFLVAWHYGIVSTALFGYGWGIAVGIIGAIRLKRPRVALVGMFLPYISAIWAVHALQGIYLAYRHARSGKTTVMTWVSPKRTTLVETVQMTNVTSEGAA